MGGAWLPVFLIATTVTHKLSDLFHLMDSSQNRVPLRSVLTKTRAGEHYGVKGSALMRVAVNVPVPVNTTMSFAS